MGSIDVTSADITYHISVLNTSKEGTKFTFEIFVDNFKLTWRWFSVITDNCSTNMTVHVTSVCGQRKSVGRAWQFTRCLRVGMYAPQVQFLAMTPQLKQTHVHHDTETHSSLNLL